MTRHIAPSGSGRSPTDREPVLRVRGLVTEYRVEGRAVRAVDGLDFELRSSQVLGVVGESGSGKTTVALSLLGLAEEVGGVVTAGSVVIDGASILDLSPKARASVRGRSISLVFQDPMTAFNPLLTVGTQMIETIRSHHPDVSVTAARERAATLLDRVGVPSAATRIDQYPNQYSGGMLQRAMIGIAIANEPQVIVADEPTTSLDVTIQAQVLELFATLVAETEAALVLVTHDLGVVAQLADVVLVMYAGRAVEFGPVADIFREPRHPYTQALLASRPMLTDALVDRRLPVIPGTPASPHDDLTGCPFHPRCQLRDGRERCVEDRPALLDLAPGRSSACHFHDELAGLPSGRSASQDPRLGGQR